jgi:hypothetical protein
MGVGLAIATASAGTASHLLDRTHDIAWLVVALVMLDLVLPRETGRLVRSGALGGFASAALLGAAFTQEGLLPVSTFGVVVVGGMLAIGALHQILLVGRGHAVEGALSGIALVTLAVGLAYSWFGPFGGTLATIVEFSVAALLWLGHLAWLDPRWRSLRRVGVPAVAASASCVVATFAFVPDAPLQRWQLGLLALGSGLLWWVTFSFARRLSNRAVWSRSGRLADGAEAARCNLVGGATLEELALGVLVPLHRAFGDAHGLPELYTLEPPLRARLDVGDRLNLRSADAPSAVMRVLFNDDHQGILDLAGLRTQVVREPSVREAVDAMESGSIGCVLPCVHLDHIEGLLLLPLLDRSETLSRVELEELRRLGDSLGGALASALAQRRADTRRAWTRHRRGSDSARGLQPSDEARADSCDRAGPDDQSGLAHCACGFAGVARVPFHSRPRATLGSAVRRGGLLGRAARSSHEPAVRLRARAPYRLVSIRNWWDAAPA